MAGGPSAAIRAECPLATDQYDGLMSAQDKLALDTISGSGVDVAFYVDSANGSDGNPGTQAQPFQTLDYAILQLPSSWKRSCTMYLEPGTYVYNPGPGNPVWNIGTPIGELGTPFALVGSYQTVVPTFSVTTGDPSPSRQLVIDAGAAFTSALIGKTIQCVSGANAGQARQVQDVVSGTTLRVQARWNSAISIGDTFTIVEPAVTIDAQSLLSVHSSSVMVGFKAVRFTSSVGANFILDANTFFKGCEYIFNFSTLNNLQVLRSANGATNALWSLMGSASPFSALETNGLYLEDGYLVNQLNGQLIGNGVTQGCYVEFTGANAQYVYGSFDFQNSLVFVDSGATFNAFSDPNLKHKVNGDSSVQMSNLLGFSYSGVGNLNIQCASNSVLFSLDVENPGGNGIVCQDPGSAVQLFDVSGGAAGATLGYGLWVVGGASAVAGIGESNFGLSDTNITGTAGDTLVGGRLNNTGATTAGLAETWAALNANFTAQGNHGITGDAGDRISITEWANQAD